MSTQHHTLTMTLAYLLDDLAYLADGHDHFYVLAHPEHFDNHTVSLARLIDELDIQLFEVEELL